MGAAIRIGWPLFFLFYRPQSFRFLHSFMIL